jgi:hypothetical protein
MTNVIRQPTPPASAKVGRLLWTSSNAASVAE